MISCDLGVDVDSFGCKSDFFLIISELSDCFSFEVEKIACFPLVRCKVEAFVACI